MLRLSASLAAVVIAGPALAQDDSQFVAFEDVLAANADRPFECNDHLEINDSCTAIGTYALSGDRLISKGFFSLAPESPAVVEVTYESTMVDGAICGFENLTASSGIDPATDEAIAEAMRSVFDSFGPLCTYYYDMGDGSYVSLTRQEDGTVIEDGRAEVTFHAEMPDLRPQDVEM
ncbi:hypothetical protein EU805_10510 [Salipiger sp. IMCC34102]|uniref:hypothetical protein n=1 Tax=Salipiger sp. IMCC34102 TaxID=2510647 RepID=UPI00101DC63A|nr:hypothetical protein [Salipiger sp. IMCC34102]RYH02274.1 hypothetical protein EU805_10510 [Salipiger sp. IMCC34102]